MASETEFSVSNLIERLIAMPFFSPSASTRSESNPDPESTNHDHPDRIILINPVTQGMVVIGGSTSTTSFDSLFTDLMRKDGQPPASQSSIDAMETLEIKSTDEIESLGSECVICMEEWGIGDMVKEMPCKHKFHGGCVEKWLKIHGSCPVCRHKMPVDDSEKKIDDESGRMRRRGEIWITFSFGNLRSTNDEESSNEEQNQ